MVCSCPEPIWAEGASGQAPRDAEELQPGRKLEVWWLHGGRPRTLDQASFATMKMRLGCMRRFSQRWCSLSLSHHGTSTHRLYTSVDLYINISTPVLRQMGIKTDRSGTWRGHPAYTLLLVGTRRLPLGPGLLSPRSSRRADAILGSQGGLCRLRRPFAELQDVKQVSTLDTDLRKAVCRLQLGIDPGELDTGGLRGLPQLSHHNPDPLIRWGSPCPCKSRQSSFVSRSKSARE